jgi:hypothetical protein
MSIDMASVEIVIVIMIALMAINSIVHIIQALTVSEERTTGIPIIIRQLRNPRMMLLKPHLTLTIMDPIYFEHCGTEWPIHITATSRRPIEQNL